MIGEAAPTLKASCRCGALELCVSGQPILSAACHCRGCQKMTGSAYSLGHAYARDDVRVVGGTAMLGGLRGPSKHHFCAECGSWVYSHPEGLDDVTVIRSTMFDPPPPEPPFIEVFRSEGLTWARTGATHSFPGSIGPGGFANLIEEFRQLRRTGSLKRSA